MLKKASGADEGGLVSKAWGWLSSLAWPVKYVVLPVLVILVGLVVEYGVIKPLLDEAGHRDYWTVEPAETVPGTHTDGYVWVAADGKVHVSGEIQDLMNDDASAVVMVIGPDPTDVRPTYAFQGAGDTKRINHSSEGEAFNRGTPKIEVRACTHDRSAGTPPKCGPPKVIYDADKYRKH